MMDWLVQPFARFVKGSSCLRLPCLNVHFPRLSVIVVNVKLADKVKSFPLNEALLSLLCAQSFVNNHEINKNKMEQVLAVPAKHFIILMDFRLVFKVCPTAHVWVVYTHRPIRFGLFKNIKSTKPWYEEYRNKEKTKQAFDNPYSDVWRIVSREEASCCLWLAGWTLWR